MAEHHPANGKRYAIYYAPEDSSELHRIGSRWLGYDAASGAECTPDLPASLSAEAWRAATEEPRRYGLHGTLKPPFRLAAGASEAGLIAMLSVFAAGREPIPLPPPRLARIGRFLALVPDEKNEALATFAADCVTRFDEFRAPPPDAETARRRAAGLSLRQEDMLLRWGYPYVMEEFRFHVTLTGPLAESDTRRFRKALDALMAPALREPLGVSSLCLFVQPAQESRFRILRRFVLGGI